MLDKISTVLINAGYDVDTACHGLAASERVLDTHYDLFIVDHLMPVMNGIQFTKHLRQHADYADATIIFMTTQGQSLVKSLCDSSLFSAIVDKPLHEAKLLNVINDLTSSNTRHQLL